ncbi:MAG TPA: hypothetical protein VJM46_02890 [Candidatus Saccharimonadales bacterium]|nr:hypothetical protein [Candidatus Saccharimonadales bacterium]
MTQRGPGRPDPEATDLFRRSWPWIGGAIAALLVCLLVIPQLLMAANISEGMAMQVGQLCTIPVGIICIVGIRRVWRS